MERKNLDFDSVEYRKTNNSRKGFYFKMERKNLDFDSVEYRKTNNSRKGFAERSVLRQGGRVMHPVSVVLP